VVTHSEALAQHLEHHGQTEARRVRLQDGETVIDGLSILRHFRDDEDA
jgi:hypothetical protein